MTRRALALALALALAGCTFAPGTGFVTLTGAELTAAVEPGPARDLGDGWILTDEAQALRLDLAELDVVEVRLEDLQGANGVTFDPANPPPGYSLCHGGHCHHDDGRLVDYVDIEAELAGGSASFVTMAALPVDRSLDLLAGETVAIGEPTDLPLGHVGRVAVQLAHLRLEGVVTDGPLGEDEVAFVLDVPWPATLTEGADIPIDRSQAPRIGLAVDVVFDGTLLDGVVVDEALTLTDPEDPRVLAVLENLSATAPVVRVLEEEE